MELVDFEKPTEPWEAKGAEKIRLAEERKQNGNEHFKRKDYDKAARRYEKALQYVVTGAGLDPKDEEQQRMAKEKRLPCYLNLAACYLKLAKPQLALKNAGKAIEMEPENVKALYRRGTAAAQLEDFDTAKVDLQRACKLDPQNKAARQELEKVLAKRKAVLAKEKKMFSKMFDPQHAQAVEAAAAAKARAEQQAQEKVNRERETTPVRLQKPS